LDAIVASRAVNVSHVVSPEIVAMHKLRWKKAAILGS
jgi:hypothetical protein